MAEELLRDRLPPGWHFGVINDGRVFFIDDERQLTSWLHPVTGLPVESGLIPDPELPRGWEQDTTRDGVIFYVDHNRGITTFEHPVYGYEGGGPPPPPQEVEGHYNSGADHASPQRFEHHQHNQHTEPGLQRPNVQPPGQQERLPTPQSPTSPGGKENFKRGTFKQRSVKAPSAKRNPQAVVVKRGWLHRLESSGISKSKTWKKRWCVLADFALFIYKGEEEQTTLDSILLPSYRINPSTEADNIKRNFVFKVEHENTKTLYLAADDSPDSISWMSLLRQAAAMDGSPGFQREPNNVRQHPLKMVNDGGDPNMVDSRLGHPFSQDDSLDQYNMSQMHHQQQQHPHYPDSQYQQQQHERQQFDPRYGHNSDRGGGSVNADDNSPQTPHQGRDNNSYHPSFNADDSFRGPNNSFHHHHQQQQHQNPSDDPRMFANPTYHQYPPNNRPSSISSGSHQQPFQQQSMNNNSHNPHVSPQQNHDQRQLRDGYAPDSARNSLAVSDTSSTRRSYHPAQAERQRLQQELGLVAPRHPDSPGRQQNMDPRGVTNLSFQRDSYSGDSSTEGQHHQQQPGRHSDQHQVVVKQLRPWDTSFPDLEVVTAKQHGSFEDLLDSGNRTGRQSSRNGPSADSRATFNARSKSHENFSRLPPQTPPTLRGNNPNQVSPQQRQQQAAQNYSPNQQPGGNYSPQQYRQQQQQQPQLQSSSPVNYRSGPNKTGDILSSNVRDSWSSNAQQPADLNRAGYQPQGQSQQQQLYHQNPIYYQHQPHMQHSPASSSLSKQGGISRDMRQPRREEYQNQQQHPQRIPHQNSESSFSNTSPQNPNRSFQQQHQQQQQHDSSFRSQQQQNPNNSSFRGTPPSQGQPQHNSSFRSQQSQQLPPSNNSSFRGMPPSHNHPPLKSSYQGVRPHSITSSIHDNQSPSSSNTHHHYNHSQQHQPNPHTYVNFPSKQHHQGSSPHSPPDRPPYPAAVRQKLVEEMAQVQTPVTQKDFLTSAQLNQQRMEQPPYFQYPSPRDQYGNRIPTNDNARQMPSHNASQASIRSGGGLDTSRQSFRHDASRNLPNSRLSSASRASSSSKRGIGREGVDATDNCYGGGQGSSPRGGQGSSPNDVSFSRTNMMDPEAQKLRMAYERVHSLRMSPDKAPPKRKPVPIQTVKEDPNMSDKEVLETNLQKISRKNPLAGPRLRMSISAGDLIGKTHDELVLLLIQLRRNQAALDKARDYYRSLLEKCKQDAMEFKRQMQQFGRVDDRRLQHRHQNYMESKSQMEEVENKLEVYKPIINLLDNMVTMGSLYGGDNLMLATQYRKHLLRPDQYQPPKKMLEFSRQHQERKLLQETEEEIRQLSSDEVDLEEKINRLNELDRLLQEQSFKVHSFKEDKELLEKALVGVLRQQDQSFHGDQREIMRLTNQQRTLEKEISRVTQQLAEASKELEETSAENSKLEHEVALLRTKVNGELTRSKSVPSLWSENMHTKQQMEKELAKVEGMMAGLNQQGKQLQQAMSTIRRSSSSSQLAIANLDKPSISPGSAPSTYLETDIDTGEQIDLAVSSLQHSYNMDYNTPAEVAHSSRPIINHQRQNAGTLEDWEMEGADENTKRFFGLVPRDKPKSQTLREVKRLSEQRKERDGRRSLADDSIDGQEIKLRVSNVDTEVSSIIHARIPSDSANSAQQYESGLPLYENLPTNTTSSSNPNLAARRSSLILMAPKPFTPYQDRSSARPFKSELSLNAVDSEGGSGSGGFTKTMTNTTEVAVPSGMWQPRSFAQTSLLATDRPYHSVDFLADTTGNNNYSINDDNNNGGHKRGDSMYSSDANNNSSVFNSNTNEDVYGEPPENAGHITRPVDLNSQTSNTRAYAPRPWATSGPQFADDSVFNSRRNSKGRYMTISSSEPIKMEINPTLHSSAGDLILNRSIDDVPDIVKSSQSRVDQIDEDTIDREILYVPDKVLIPERYDAEADAEQLTEEEKEARRDRAERIRRMLTSQSVLSVSQPDVSQLQSEDVHSRVQKEKKERAHFLALGQELARQVTLKSKKQAAERRKTWSGAQFADAKAQYDAEMAGNASNTSSPLRSPDGEKRRAGITLHDL